jgi:ankyrin repeat protein
VVIQDKPSTLQLQLPRPIQTRVKGLATALVQQISTPAESQPDSSSLLGYLTRLIVENEEEKDFTNNGSTVDWISLITNAKYSKKLELAQEFILAKAPEFFTDSSAEKKIEYIERFLPQELTDSDFNHLQELARDINPGATLDRLKVFENKKADLRASLTDWFNYLNDPDGGVTYLNNKTRHWIFNAVADLEVRILDNKPNLSVLEGILEKPDSLASHTDIDTASFEKFQDIISRHARSEIAPDEIKAEIIQTTQRNPELDDDFKDKLNMLFSDGQLDKVILYSLILNDPRNTKVNFQNRSSPNSIKDFPVLNPALVGEINDIVKLCEIHSHTKIMGEIQKKYEQENPNLYKFLKDNIDITKGNGTVTLHFSSLYKFLQNQTTSKIDLSTTDGEWRKFPKDSEPKELRDSIKYWDTGWCLQGLDTADRYLKQGDIYIYFSQDKNKNPVLPRLAIAMNGDEISEIRGIAARQNLDGFIANATGDNGISILQEKLQSRDADGKPVFPNLEKWLRADKDTKALERLYGKFQKNIDFTEDDLFFIYEIVKGIKNFGRNGDPRIEKILKTRDREKDLTQIFGDAYKESELKSSLSRLEAQIFRDRDGDKSNLRMRPEGENIFIFALSEGHIELMDQLIENLPPDKLVEAFTEKSIYHSTVPNIAYNKSHFKVIKQLIDLSPDKLVEVLAKNRNYLSDLLYILVQKNYSGFIKPLIEKLPPSKLVEFLKEKDVDGYTVLMIAARKSITELMDQLIKNLPAAQVVELVTEKNSLRHNDTVLMIAARGGVIKQIIKNLPADKLVNALTEKNDLGYTALIYDIQKGHTEVLELIIKNLLPNELVKALTGTFVNNSTLLMQAANNDNIRAVELIIENLPSDKVVEFVNQGSSYFGTALQAANNQTIRDFLNKTLETYANRA